MLRPLKGKQPAHEIVDLEGFTAKVVKTLSSPKKTPRTGGSTSRKTTKKTGGEENLGEHRQNVLILPGSIAGVFFPRCLADEPCPDTAQT